jgi:hypothetical protein
VRSVGYGTSASGRASCVRSILVARPVTLVRERVLLSDRYDRTNEIQSETHGVHWGGRGGVTGRGARPVRPDQRVRSPRVWLFREPTTLFFWGLLYILVGQLKALTLALFDILVSTLS